MKRLFVFLFLVSILATASGYSQTPALVASTASTTGGATPSKNTTGANMIAVCAYKGLTITDSPGNVYTQVSNPRGGYAGTAPTLYISFAPTTSATHTFSSSGTYPFNVSVFSNVASGPDSVVEAYSVNNYPLPIGPITPTNPNMLIYGCFDGNFGGVSSPSAVFSGMTTNAPTGLVAGGIYGTADAYVVQAGTGAFSTNVTMNQSNGADGILATFYSIANPAPLVITTTGALPEAVSGVTYTTAYAVPGSSSPVCLKATGGITPLSWALTSGTLPSGITFSASSGCFGGSHTGTVIRTPLTFSVTDSHSTVATSGTLTLSVASAAMTLPVATFALAKQLTAYSGGTVAASGGLPPYTYSYAVLAPGDVAQYQYNALPEGMALNGSTGAVTATRVEGEGEYVVQFNVVDSGGAFASTPMEIDIDGDNSYGGTQLFPSDHVVHLKVSGLPVLTGAWAQMYYTGKSLFPAFGAYPGNVGGSIPVNTVPYNQPTHTVQSNFFFQNTTSTFAPCDAAIEQGWNGVGNPPSIYLGDNHILTVQTAGPGVAASMMEMYQGYPNWPAWTGGAPTCSYFGSAPDNYGGAVQWDLSSYALTQGQASADEAGLPLIPYIETYDEVLGTGTPGAENGVPKHAIRATFVKMLKAYVWPGQTYSPGPNVGGCTHYYNADTHLIDQHDATMDCGTGGITGVSGEIFRLKASFSEPTACSSNPVNHIIFQQLKDYGIIAADNGNSGYFMGTPDHRWPAFSTLFNCFGAISLSQFEPVDTQSAAVAWPNSAQVSNGTPGPVTAAPSFLPGTSSFTTSVTVTVSDATSGATSHCTTDGSTPTSASPICASSYSFTTLTTLRAYATSNGNADSLITSATYTTSSPAPPSSTVGPSAKGAVRLAGGVLIK